MESDSYLSQRIHFDGATYSRAQNPMDDKMNGMNTGKFATLYQGIWGGLFREKICSYC